MATIAQIRTGIKDRLATISGLNAYDIVPSTVNPPAAVVYGPEIDFDSTMARGSDDYRFWVILLVSRVSDRSGQELLDTYLAPSGATSVKEAVDGNLGGVVDFARVSQVREYGDHDVNGVSFYSAAIQVEVTA